MEEADPIAGEQFVHFESDGLRLEGVLCLVPDINLSAVVLHPHPLYGGDMHNHVVVTLCAALSSVGATTLRFNFRGAGASGGRFENGRGEAHDALGAVAFLREAAPCSSVLLAGYSFGATVAAAVALRAGAAALVLVSPPVAFAPLNQVPDAVPTLVITGSLDEIAPPHAIQALGSASCAVEVVDGADHSWWSHTTALAGLVSSFVRATVHP